MDLSMDQRHRMRYLKPVRHDFSRSIAEHSHSSREIALLIDLLRLIDPDTHYQYMSMHDNCNHGCDFDLYVDGNNVGQIGITSDGPDEFCLSPTSEREAVTGFWPVVEHLMRTHGKFIYKKKVAHAPFAWTTDWAHSRECFDVYRDYDTSQPRIAHICFQHYDFQLAHGCNCSPSVIDIVTTKFPEPSRACTHWNFDEV